ncbi:MAG TPA: tRNA pseudouridine(55) synthase TruB [Paracoccaceae bacterium]|nr:tRNA pseudouridine(55) synthase TruB [Paracoccaceae bacterium]
MARKRKGRAITGWLIVDKPAGTTSTAIVNKARWAFRAQKAGHAGTLDPLATGLLAIAFGDATKTIPFAQEGMKTYRFTVRLGERTTTDDTEGEVIARSDQRPSDDEIRAALPRFTGDIEQIPPQFSAVRVEGERAYDLAREGVELDLAPRPLFVERLALLARPDTDTAELELICGKGGYVRSIARDLGEALGCHAHVTALKRTASGGFTLDDAIPFERLDAIREEGEESDWREHLLPLHAGLSELPEIRISAPEAARLRRGNPVPVATTTLDYGDEAWASSEGNAVALVRYAGGMLNPTRVFAAPPQRPPAKDEG